MFRKAKEGSRRFQKVQEGSRWSKKVQDGSRTFKNFQDGYPFLPRPTSVGTSHGGGGGGGNFAPPPLEKKYGGIFQTSYQKIILKMGDFRHTQKIGDKISKMTKILRF